MAPAPAPAPSPAPFDETSKTVCVMDAAGRLGSSLVHALLLRGYTVHAATQHPGKLHCLEEFLSGYKKKLRVFDSDPFDYHSIMEALKGCCGLFYSFEPPSDHPSYDEFMAEVEVRAAHNVLEACAQTHTMDKVVFTSSVTAVIWANSNTTNTAYDERSWSDINLCRKFKLWHALSKTLAEKTAWALAMDRGINMVTINGGLLMGPDLSIAHPYLKGAAEMYEEGVFVTVDLAFIVHSHICVFEDMSAYGRYLCYTHLINRNEDALQLANLLLPPSQSSLPQRPEDKRVHQQRISNNKLSKIITDFDNQLRID